MALSLLEIATQQNFACRDYSTKASPQEDLLVANNDDLVVVSHKAQRIADRILDGKSIAASINAEDDIATQMLEEQLTGPGKLLWLSWKSGASLPPMTWTNAADQSGDKVAGNANVSQQEASSNDELYCKALAALYRLDNSFIVTTDDCEAFMHAYNPLTPLLEAMHLLVEIQQGEGEVGEQVQQRQVTQEHSACLRAFDAIERQKSHIKATVMREFDKIDHNLAILQERIKAVAPRRSKAGRKAKKKEVSFDAEVHEHSSSEPASSPTPLKSALRRTASSSQPQQSPLLQDQDSNLGRRNINRTEQSRQSQMAQSQGSSLASKHHVPDRRVQSEAQDQWQRLPQFPILKHVELVSHANLSPLSRHSTPGPDETTDAASVRGNLTADWVNKPGLVASSHIEEPDASTAQAIEKPLESGVQHQANDGCATQSIEKSNETDATVPTFNSAEELFEELRKRSAHAGAAVLPATQPLDHSLPTKDNAQTKEHHRVNMAEDSGTRSIALPSWARKRLIDRVSDAEDSARAESTTLGASSTDTSAESTQISGHHVFSLRKKPRVAEAGAGNGASGEKPCHPGEKDALAAEYASTFAAPVSAPTPSAFGLPGMSDYWKQYETQKSRSDNADKTTVKENPVAATVQEPPRNLFYDPPALMLGHSKQSEPHKSRVNTAEKSTAKKPVNATAQEPPRNLFYDPPALMLGHSKQSEPQNPRVDDVDKDKTKDKPVEALAQEPRSSLFYNPPALMLHHSKRSETQKSHVDDVNKDKAMPAVMTAQEQSDKSPGDDGPNKSPATGGKALPFASSASSSFFA